MSKNGFTLVELLITIGLLSLLGVLIANNMVGIQSKQLQSNYENYKKQIANAACQYIESKDITPNKIYKFPFTPPIAINLFESFV